MDDERRLQWARDWPEDVLAELDKVRRKLDQAAQERDEARRVAWWYLKMVVRGEWIESAGPEMEQHPWLKEIGEIE